MSGERARELDKAAEDIFQRMLADHMLTTAIRAHRQAKRSIVPCAACGTKCRSHSTILPSLAATSSVSRASTPSSTATSSHTLQANGGSSSSLAALNGTSGTRTPSSGVGGSTGIGSGSGKPDGNGNVFFECLNCGRPTASTRYATHLSGCLGIGGSRRAASRVAAAKVKMGANDRSSPSPYVHAEVGLDSDNESLNGGAGRKKKGRAPVVNGVKRAASPAKATLSKKAKSGSLAPSSRSNMPYAPSRLRASPANASSPTSTPSPTRSTQSLPSGFGSASKTLPGSGLAMGGWGMGIGGDLAGTVEAEPADAAAALGSESSDGGADDDY